MLIWPFPTRNPDQFRRIDQGWDLQTTAGTPIFAVADGTIHYAHNAPGFGDPYPVLMMDLSIDGNLGVYYGHNHPEVPEFTHVAQGQIIAHTLEIPGGNAAGYPGWLEIGWWIGGPTGNGQSMHDHLINAPIWAGGDDEMAGWGKDGASEADAIADFRRSQIRAWYKLYRLKLQPGEESVPFLNDALALWSQQGGDAVLAGIIDGTLH